MFRLSTLEPSLNSSFHFIFYQLINLFIYLFFYSKFFGGYKIFALDSMILLIYDEKMKRVEYETTSKNDQMQHKDKVDRKALHLKCPNKNNKAEMIHSKLIISTIFKWGSLN